MSTATIEQKAKRVRKTEAEHKHDYYLNLAVLLRQGRLHRLPVQVKRAAFDVDGKHVDVYASSTYTGYAYIVTYGNQGYECGCERFEHKHSCPHTQDANARAKARYEQQEQLHEATIVATALLPEMAQHDDTVAHVEDSIASGELDEPALACFSPWGGFAHVLSGGKEWNQPVSELDRWFPGWVKVSREEYDEAVAVAQERAVWATLTDEQKRATFCNRFDIYSDVA